MRNSFTNRYFFPVFLSALVVVFTGCAKVGLEEDEFCVSKADVSLQSMIPSDISEKYSEYISKANTLDELKALLRDNLSEEDADKAIAVLEESQTGHQSFELDVTTFTDVFDTLPKAKNIARLKSATFTSAKESPGLENISTLILTLNTGKKEPLPVINYQAPYDEDSLRTLTLKSDTPHNLFDILSKDVQKVSIEIDFEGKLPVQPWTGSVDLCFYLKSSTKVP